MKKIVDNPLLTLISRIIVGSFFIIVATSKIGDVTKFANEINNYDMLPNMIINILALFLPWLELVTGIFLIAGVKIKTNSLIMLLLTLVFTIAVLSAMARGLDINCGCYSAIKEKKVGWEKVLENTGLMLLLLQTYFSKSNNFLLEKPN